MSATTHEMSSKSGVATEPSTTRPFEKDGRVLLPLRCVLKRRNGYRFRTATLRGWHTNKWCPPLGREIDSERVLAASPTRRNPAQRWWATCFAEADIIEIERVKNDRRINGPKPRTPKPPRKPDEPGPDWITAEKTMEITGAAMSTLARVRRNVGSRPFPSQKEKGKKGPKRRRGKLGFVCAGGKRLPLHAKVFMLPQGRAHRRDTGTNFTRVVPTTLYYKPHADAVRDADWRKRRSRRASTSTLMIR